MSIVTNCMTVNLAIGMWEGRRLDKGISRKVVEEAHATDMDAVRVNKLLVAKTSLDPVNKCRNAMRGHFLERTLPWRDNGDRLLTRKMFTVFVEEHEKLAGEFKDEVDNFLRNVYPVERDRAAFRMGELFNPDDYPRADELRHKFYVTLEIDAIAEAGDFRVALDSERVTAIQEQIESATQQRIQKAVGDVWERVRDTVTHFAEKMADSDAVFRDSTVTNLEKLIDALPALDPIGDPNLKKIGKALKAKLYGFEPKDLRKNPDVRASAAAEAQEIIDQMTGFMTALRVA